MKRALIAQMSGKQNSVLGVTAPAGRPTIAGALWLAGLATLPVAVLVAVAHLIGWLF